MRHVLKLLPIFLAHVAMAQSGTLTPSAPASVQRGTTFTLAIASGGGTGTGPVAVQWDLTIPAGWTVSPPTTVLAGKTVSCAGNNLRCILYGATTNTVIANGTAATYTVTVPPLATLGAATVTTSATLSVSNAGIAIVTTGGSATITITADKRDLTGDGIVDQSDVTAAVSQMFGACTTADINGDTKCDLLDLILVLLKAQGIIP